MAYGFIYRITNMINGKVYIGQSINVTRRLKDHRHDLLSNKHKNCHLQSAWNKYGEDNFVFEIIDEAEEQFVLNNLEAFWVDAYGGVDSGMNYNLMAGGGNKGKPSKETRNKMSEWQTGKRLNDETKHKLSIAAKQRFENPENHPMYNKHHSEESKKKISENHPDQSGESNGMFGRHHSEESKKKMSESSKGIHPSEEAKVKMSDSQKARWTDEMREEWSKRFSGANNPMFGKCMSEEAKQTLSEKAKQRFENPENHPMAHAVICIDTEDIFHTIKQASETYNISRSSIAGCCRKENKSAGGYRWMFLDEWESLSNKEKETSKNTVIGKAKGESSGVSKYVLCVEINEVFVSLTEASRILNINLQSISDNLHGRNKTAGGYHWKYIAKEEYLAIKNG